MKYLILNEIYSVNLFYYLFLNYYIFKYVVLIDEENDECGENFFDGESPSATLFLFIRVGTGTRMVLRAKQTPIRCHP